MIPKIQDPRKTCLTCHHFQFIEGHKPRNRACTYDGAIKFEYGSCKSWKNMFSVKDRVKAKLHLTRLHRKTMVS